MNYLIAVLSDRIKAEAAYLALEKQDIKSTILGKGYKTADEFGLVDPKEPAKKQVKLMALWLVPFGFFAGFSFSFITNLQTFAWAGEIGNHIVGGLLGAVSGGLGSLFVGGGVGLFAGSGDALAYRNRLNANKYLIIVKSSESIIQKATPILRQFGPENIQGYADNTLRE